VENKLKNVLHELQGIVREGDRLTYKGKKYVRETSTIFCEVTELQMLEGYLQSIPGENSKIKPSFQGKVRLKTDTICVVGAYLSERTELGLSIVLAEPQSEFTLLTEEQRAAKAARDEERRQQELYQPPDWRDAIYGQDAITTISVTEGLWLYIYAPRAMLDALQSAFEAGRLHRVSLGLECGLWVEESSAYLSFKKWFLFPERVSESGVVDFTIDFERAHGWLSHFHINSAPLRLATQDEDLPDVRAAAPPAITDADRRTLHSISRALWWLVALAVLALIHYGSR
jgi:hypothetical protein